ncbi:MAG: EAL domain-containing protein [Rhodospirillales bacterium]|nr:EAL domain-containing protein [Rhodospirillales bacterium]
MITKPGNSRPSGAHRLRFMAAGVVCMLIATFIAGIVFGVRAAGDFDAVRKSWDGYMASAEAKGNYLSQIRGAIGYGGLIHHYKDYVVRQDPEMLVQVRRDLAELRRLILRYEALGVIQEEQIAIRQLRSTIGNYEVKLVIAQDSVAKGRDPAQADILSKIDDYPALEALSFLEEVWRESRDETTEALNQTVVSGRDAIKRGVMFLPALLISVVFLLWFLQRLLREIADRSRAELELRKLTQVVEQSPASVIISDTAGVIEYVNPTFVDVTGYSSDEFVGRNVLDLQSGLTAETAYDGMWDTVLAGNEWRGELHSRKKNGDSFWEYATVAPLKGTDGSITNFIHSKEDITLRKEYEERLLRQANFDDLTDLPNRVLALDRLSQAIAGAHHGNRTVVIMHADIDNFRNVNDLLGRATGDRLLKEMAERLSRCLHKGDTVARLGSDEFLAVLPDLNAAVHAEAVAQDILDAVARPFIMGGQEIFLTASIGLTVYPSDGYDPHVLMRDAEAAMYRAKERGRNGYRFFRPEMNAQAVQRLEVETQLRHALERDELFLHYQPIVKPDTGDVVGAEALLRWQNPDLGLVWPDRLIPIAEETGLIVPIGAWVLRTACRDAKAWQDWGAKDLRVTINLSIQQFAQGDLFKAVSDALNESGLAPKFLELEIKESVVMADDPATLSTLAQVRELGVRLSIDDFGTGPSSINYLKRFPFDVLKIDRTFVRGLVNNPEDQAVATAIIAMAHSLNIIVVGEGVETVGELKFLLGEGCDQVQGFYFSEPLPQEDFNDMLKDGGESGRIVFI